MKLTFLFIFIPFLTYANDNFVEIVKHIIHADPHFNQVKYQNDYKRSLKTGAQSQLYMPNLSLSVSEIKENSLSSGDQSYKVGSINLNYKLFNFGSDYLNFKSQKNQYAAYKEELKQTILQKEKEIISLLLSRIKTVKSILIQNDVISLKEKTFQITKKRFNRGSLSKNDLTRIRLDLINTKSDLINLKQTLFSYDSQLSAYGITEKINEFPWTIFFIKSGLSNINKIKNANQDNPNIQRYKLLAQANEYEATSTSLGHLGSFSLNYNRNVHQEDSNDAYSWSTSIVYTLPLFENFSKHAQVQKARANVNAAEVAYLYNKRLIQSQSSIQRDNLILTHQNFTERMAVLTDLDSLSKNVESRFQKGVLSINNLFIEQDRLLTTKNHTNTAIYNLHISYLDFLHIHGISVTNTSSYLK